MFTLNEVYTKEMEYRMFNILVSREADKTFREYQSGHNNTVYNLVEELTLQGGSE